jgi:ABC-type transporter Mla subunit MlaD
MDKRTIKKLLKQAEATKARIAKERDRLRDITDELASICDDCDEAVDNMVNAADALSRLL